MNKNIITILAVVALNVLSFYFGRYNFYIGKNAITNKPTIIIHSYKDYAKCSWEAEGILMDIINNIYEIDGTYFRNIIETDSNYNRLIEHYNKWEGQDNWDWDSMYNL